MNQEPEQRAGPPAVPANAASHRLACLIVLAAAAMQVGRIVQVESTTGEVPFLSANDRSRWCTIAALAIKGTYEIDDIIYIRDPETRRRTWYSIDLVRHRGPDGQQHFYSSKPPLLPTLYAGVYLGLRQLTGATLMQSPFPVARWMLLLVNLIPLVALWWLLIRWLRGQGLDAWAFGTLAVFLAWGTYLSTFVNTLNNHLPAAIAAGVSLWCIDRVLLKQDHRVRWFVLCGLSTSFCATNELPALAWVCAAGVLLAFANVRLAVLAYGLSLLPFAAAFFATNYAAHRELAPAYAHRSVGEKLFEVELSTSLSDEAQVLPELIGELQQHGFEFSEQSTIRQARQPNTWELWDEGRQSRLALQPIPPEPDRDSGQSSDDAPSVDSRIDSRLVGVYEWGDWYDYPDSYWTDENKEGVDRGEPNRGLYIFHSLIGHHGIFSLTPFWLVAMAGVFTVPYTGGTWNPFRDHRLLLTAALVVTSTVVIGFYFARGLEDRNYGGISSGFRWSFWLIPFWLWLAVQAMREIRATWLRRGVELLVVMSVFSACYPWRNPWTSPWPMQLMEYLGWL